MTPQSECQLHRLLGPRATCVLYHYDADVSAPAVSLLRMLISKALPASKVLEADLMVSKRRQKCALIILHLSTCARGVKKRQ